MTLAMMHALMAGGAPATVPAITLAFDLPAGTVGVAYSGSVTATNINGATGAITITYDALPAGLTAGTIVDNGDGSYTLPISGTPTGDGTTSVTWDASNGTQSESAAHDVVVEAASVVAYWDPTVKNAGITLSGTDNSIASAAASGWKSVRGVTGNSSGKRYLEFKNLTSGVMVMAGLCDATPNLNGYGGSDAHGWTDYGSNGNVYHSGSSKACLPTGWVTAAGYVLRVFHDPATGSIWFGLGGSGVAGGSYWIGDPEAGTGAAYTGVFGTLYPCGSPNTVGAALGLRVKSSEFEYAIPAGGTSWSGE